VADVRFDPAAIEARCRAATPGPWQWAQNGLFYKRIGEAFCERLILEMREPAIRRARQEDGDFIKHARTDLPAAVARVRELEAELNAARADARVLAHAFERDTRPPSAVVARALAYPTGGDRG